MGCVGIPCIVADRVPDASPVLIDMWNDIGSFLVLLAVHLWLHGLSSDHEYHEEDLVCHSCSAEHGSEWNWNVQCDHRFGQCQQCHPVCFRRNLQCWRVFLGAVSWQQPSSQPEWWLFQCNRPWNFP